MVSEATTEQASEVKAKATPSDSIPRRLFKQAKERPHAPAHYTKVSGEWKKASYAELADEVKRASKALIALGLEAGQTSCILGFNRAEWVVFDVATMAVGAAPAGIYTTCSAEEVKYIVAHAAAPVVLVENDAQWKKVEERLADLPDLKWVVFMKGAAVPAHEMALSWDDFLKKGDGVVDAEFFARLDAIEPGGLATLIYTSGTTGPPKGVMISHRNLTWTCDLARDLTKVDGSDVSLSYLPLSHIAEQIFSIHAPITNGSSIYFAESLEKVPDNLKEVQPTVFFGVPRIWEKFHAGIRAKLREAPPLKKKIAAFAMKVGRQMTDCRATGREPSAVLALQYKLANKLVFSKLKPAIGLGRARVCVSGAAPIAREVLEFFASLDVLVLEVYGQSEDTGPTSFNVAGKTRFGTVGPIIPGIDVKIADDGEILVKGPNVFLGYYKEPEATAETLKEGWLHSGDLGAIDAAGFLSITGRKKEIIITAGGKNIAPKNIEGSIKNHPLVSEAVVIGDRRKFLTALVMLDAEAAAKFVKDRGAAGDPAESPEVRAEVQKAIDDANRDLARVETVKKFTIVKKPFGIDTGELTPTLKIKRKVVAQNYASEIEAMYVE